MKKMKSTQLKIAKLAKESKLKELRERTENLRAPLETDVEETP